MTQIGFCGVANVSYRLFDIREDFLGVLNELRSGLCQANLPGGPKKQSRTELVFKGRYAFGKGGLAEPQTLAGLAEVKFLSDGDETFQLPDIQFGFPFRSFDDTDAHSVVQPSFEGLDGVSICQCVQRVIAASDQCGLRRIVHLEG